MTTSPSHPGEVLTDLDAVTAAAAPEASDAPGRLTGSRSGLDSRLIRLGPGASRTEGFEAGPDVLIVVLQGAGTLDTRDGPRQLQAHTAAWLPQAPPRALTAGPDGMTYLSTHPRPGTGHPEGTASPEGGESACLLHRVCPDCGRLATEPGARHCSRCGSPLPD
ncbi:hypothetical protein ABZ128_24690 [Streptomyces sp. NPDC006326]|uniref:hypothetical protein n=1 Tax=Streptomyces sp. NPDC006326 TaxID=3156752 RepID=UPI0033B4882F